MRGECRKRFPSRFVSILGIKPMAFRCCQGGAQLRSVQPLSGVRVSSGLRGLDEIQSSEVLFPNSST